MVSSGNFRHYVTFEQRSKDPDEGGGRAGSWVAVHANVPGEMRPLSSREISVAAAKNLEISHRFEMRYLTGFNSAWRINWQGRFFAVIGARDEEERRRLMILDLLERKELDFK